MKSIFLTCGLALIAFPALSAEIPVPIDDDNPDTMVESLSTVVDDSLQEDHQRHPEFAQARRICKKVKLTDDQKQELKTVFREHRQNTAQSRADLQAARKKFIQLIKDDQAVAADASVAVSEGVAAKTALSQARGDLATKVMFEILTPAQRVPALRCIKALKKAHRAHHDHHGGHHGGHGSQN